MGAAMLPIFASETKIFFIDLTLLCRTTEWAREKEKYI